MTSKILIGNVREIVEQALKPLFSRGAAEKNPLAVSSFTTGIAMGLALINSGSPDIMVISLANEKSRLIDGHESFQS